MATISRIRALFDTNGLIYASDATSPYHEASLALRDGVEDGSIDGCITPQVLLEFFSLVTTKRVTSPRTIDEAWAEANALASVFTVLSPPNDLVDRLGTLFPTTTR